MMVDLRRTVAAAVQDAVAAVTGERIDLPSVEDPPRPQFGDLALPVALELARRLERPPRQLAEQLLDWLRDNPTPSVCRWQIAGPGYLNAFFDRAWVLQQTLAGLEPGGSAEFADGGAEFASGDAEFAGGGAGFAGGGTRLVVEHTSINPNKAAHIGHLRNACLGDALARVLRYQGHDVEVQNYIDDTGVQVADVVLGFYDVRGLDAAAVAALPEPFDYTCWDLYTEVTELLDADEALQHRRREVLLALERHEGMEAEVAAVVSDRICRRHIGTLQRLDIRYDLLVREGDVVAMDLWAAALQRLKDSGSIYFADDGKHAGCWMMRLEGMPGFEDLEEPDKVLVRSNGTATYVAKDIAYHMWKYGLLDDVFAYERFVDGPGEHVTYRSARAGVAARPAAKGATHRGYNVVDVRQSYLQQIVTVALRALSEDAPFAVAHTHFAYEMVALTPRTAAALGIPIAAADRGKAYVEMSGRRGYGVKADDLLDALEQRAAAEVARRNPELDDAAVTEVGRQIALAAVRYFLLKYARNTVIAFDMEDALSFEGETGPYLQYTAARARSIFTKIEDQWNESPAAAVAAARRRLEPGAAAAMLDAEDAAELWGLLLQLMRFERAARQSVDNLEISTLAKYAFGLAQAYNHVYHRYPILREPDEAARDLRILLTHAFRVRFAEVLELLGIPVPARM